MTSRGMSEAFAQGLADMMTAKNEGIDNTASRAVAADTPTTFREWSEAVLKPAVVARASPSSKSRWGALLPAPAQHCILMTAPSRLDSRA